jgi:hypothetical protein
MVLAPNGLRPPSADAQQLQRKRALAMQRESSGCVAEMLIKSLHFCHREYDSYSYPQVSTGFYSVYVLEIIVQRSSAAILSVTNVAIKKSPSAFPWRVFQLGLRAREE